MTAARRPTNVNELAVCINNVVNTLLRDIMEKPAWAAADAVAAMVGAECGARVAATGNIAVVKFVLDALRTGVGEPRFTIMRPRGETKLVIDIYATENTVVVIIRDEPIPYVVIATLPAPL